MWKLIRKLWKKIVAFAEAVMYGNKTWNALKDLFQPA